MTTLSNVMTMIGLVSTLFIFFFFCYIVQLDGHGGTEVLAGDWDKYSHPVVATGCADGTVRTWDLRLPRYVRLKA